MSKEPTISPRFTLLSLIAIGILSLVMMLVTPVGGIPVGGMKIKFKSFSSIFEVQGKPKIEDVGKYLDEIFQSAVDSVIARQTITTDSSEERVVVRAVTKTSLQFKNDDSSPMFSFFEALDSASGGKGMVHILHYGDSQIESDRMTGYIRQQLQEKFGGYGPGLIPPVPIAPPGNINLTRSDNWKRYTAYGFTDKKAAHNRFGIMCSFGRFKENQTAETIATADTTEAWIELRPSAIAHGRNKTYSGASIYLGNHLSDLTLEMLIDDSLIESKTIAPQSAISEYHWNFASTPSKLRFVFRGTDSPDVHAINLQNSTGIYMDNIALRGSNGNIFKRIASAELKSQMNDIHTQLILMQFGGNSIPYVNSDKSASEYGRFFQAQIQYIRQVLPNVPIVIIGPSDMSTTIDGTLQTWPYLEKVRNAMKDAAFAENCAFWDMYEVMGGKNSMVSWVENDPPYAGTDYTHFTPLGARKVAELLYKAIKEEYDAWKKAGEAPIPNPDPLKKTETNS